MEHVLQLDISGTPQNFVTIQEAALAYSTGSVAWEIGDSPLCTMRGGTNAATGQESAIQIYPIIALNGYSRINLYDVTPTLTNLKLFRRDRSMCGYCGIELPFDKLTRDHIVPQSKGGKNTWVNVVTSCKICNCEKDSKDLADFRRKLLFVPYTPSIFEDLLLQGRKIRADVHDWIVSQLPSDSRLN